MSSSGRVCALLVMMAACGGASDARPLLGAGDLTLAFPTDAAIDVGAEQYLCFVYERGALEGAPLESIAWDLPDAGPVAVHHISLYALTEAPAAGPIDCDASTWGVGPRFATYTHAQKRTTLPDGVALRLPEATRWIGAEVHVLRTALGASAPGRVVLHPPERAPAHLAVWMEANLAVPPLPPRAETSSTRRCTVAGEVHVVAAWPHMHRMGKTFDSSLTRAPTGSAANDAPTPLLRVDPWDFTHQPLYAEDLVLGAGDAVDLTCTWDNTSDETILGGPYTSNEMCSFAFIAWPAEAARCTE